MNDDESLRILRALDEGTGWSDDGDMLSANDPGPEDEDDGGLATVPSRPHLHPIDGGTSDELDSMDGTAHCCRHR